MNRIHSACPMALHNIAPLRMGAMRPSSRLKSNSWWLGGLEGVILHFHSYGWRLLFLLQSRLLQEKWVDPSFSDESFPPSLLFVQTQPHLYIVIALTAVSLSACVLHLMSFHYLATWFNFPLYQIEGTILRACDSYVREYGGYVPSNCLGEGLVLASLILIIIWTTTTLD